MTTMLHITPSRVTAGGGKFDTQRRYLRNGTASGNFPICKDRTMELAAAPSGSGNNNYTSWRFSVGAGQYSVAYTDSAGSPVSHDPAYTIVRT